MLPRTADHVAAYSGGHVPSSLDTIFILIHEKSKKCRRTHEEELSDLRRP
jgi:hypothetical protein